MAPGSSSVRHRLELWNGGLDLHDLGDYRRRMAEIDRLEPRLKRLDDNTLRQFSQRLASQAREGTSLDEIVEEAAALVREAAWRILGQRPFGVQVLAGLAMHDGRLVEMATGEGKTLAAVLPAYLGGLFGRGVHVLTFNDYLAHRDAEWMGPIYRFLGLSAGWVGEGMSRRERQEAYGCDVTYVTAKEAGFDLLRSHLASEPEDIVHRPFHLAIVDEADSILIDEARVPLVIAGVLGSPEETPYGLAELVERLDPEEHFAIDEYSRNIELTAIGIDRVEGVLDCGNLLAAENLALLTGINCALHAKVLLRRDVDYIVRDGRIQLVDELTGRVVEDRHWPDGLQAALEAKEGLKLRPEGRVLSSITLQHFIRLYPKLAGMTATASPAAEEVRRTYGIDVVVIPQNRPSIRVDHPDVIFTHRLAKHRALVEEIGRIHATGRPILVGTASVKESEELAALLRQSGIETQILNARNDEMEAAIIAEAGALGAVTISTNMAGRGTDIRLGGADERTREDVVVLGGLYVIGTNRHESLRIDQQLRGRAGRQGDPGSSRFFISLEDDLIVRYGVRNLIPPKLLPQEQDEPLDNPVIRREIARAQRIVEGQNIETRKTLCGYSSVLEEQRKIVQQRREDLLSSRGPGRLAELSPGRFEELSSTVGQEVLAEAERWIMLFQFDRFWSEHLATMAEIREGIHLRRVSGQDPFAEYVLLAADAFSDMESQVEEEAVRTFEAVTITEEGLDLDKEGLKGPSSTWTYLINDDPFRDQLSMALGGNVAFAAGAALPFTTGPLLILWGLYKRYFRDRSRKD